MFVGPTPNSIPIVIVVTELVSAPRPLGPTGITLVGAMTGGGMTYIDIDASVAQSWAATQRLASDLTLITSAGATLAFGDAGQAAFAFRRGVQQPLSGVFATEGVKLPGLIDGTIWVPAPELGTSRSGVAYRLVTSDGLPVDGATIDLPEAELIGSDGHGGLVVARGGDVFVVSVDGAERLSSGELIAIAADTAYVREVHRGHGVRCHANRSPDRCPFFVRRWLRRGRSHHSVDRSRNSARNLGLA